MVFFPFERNQGKKDFAFQPHTLPRLGSSGSTNLSDLYPPLSDTFDPPRPPRNSPHSNEAIEIIVPLGFTDSPLLDARAYALSFFDRRSSALTSHSSSRHLMALALGSECVIRLFCFILIFLFVCFVSMQLVLNSSTHKFARSIILLLSNLSNAANSRPTLFTTFLLSSTATIFWYWFNNRNC